MPGMWERSIPNRISPTVSKAYSISHDQRGDSVSSALRTRASAEGRLKATIQEDASFTIIGIVTILFIVLHAQAVTGASDRV